MKKEQFFRLLGDLDDGILEQYRQMDAQLSINMLRKKRALRVLTIAACLVLLIGVCVPVGMMIAKWVEDRPAGPGPEPDPWGESSAQPGTDEPPQQDSVIRIDSLAELEEMREMLECKDEQVLEEYLQSVMGGNSKSKQELANFIALVDHTPYARLIDGELAYLEYQRGPSAGTGELYEVLYVTVTAPNGEWVRCDYQLSWTDVEKTINKFVQNSADENLLPAPLSTADGRLTLYVETRGPHPTYDGDYIQWWCVLDGQIVRIDYFVADADMIDTAALFGSLMVADSITVGYPEYAWANTEFGAFLQKPIHYIYSFADIPDSAFSSGAKVDVFSDRYQDLSAPATITHEYQGKEYELVYSHTESMAWLSMQAKHVYRSQEVRGMEAATDKETGELISFSVFTSEISDQTPVSMEQLEKTARAFLAEKVSDPGAYRLDKVQDQDSEVSFLFVRYLDDLPTSDRMSVILNKQGEMQAYYLRYLGSMRHASSVPDALMQSVTNILERYADSDGTYSIEKVVLTPDGRLALDCEIRIPDDFASFLIYLTEPIK